MAQPEAEVLELVPAKKLALDAAERPRAAKPGNPVRGAMAGPVFSLKRNLPRPVADKPHWRGHRAEQPHVRRYGHEPWVASDDDRRTLIGLPQAGGHPVQRR